MDFMDLLSNTQIRNVSASKYKSKAHFMKSSKLRFSNQRRFSAVQFNNIYYADLKLNRMILTTNFTEYKMYELQIDRVIGPTTTFWSRTDLWAVGGLPCATWGDDCRYFIASGCGSSVKIIDSETTSIIEEISLDPERANFVLSTLGHAISPHHTNIVAVANTDGGIPVIDLRTGNFTTMTNSSTREVNSITWSPYHEHIVAVTTNTTHTLQLWDLRHFRHYQTSIRCSTEMLPDLQFLDYSRLACLKSSSLDIMDIYKEEIVSQVITEQIHGHKRKNQFAVNHNCSPKLIYLPVGDELGVLNLRTNALINTYRENLFPIEIAVLNESLGELYTFSNQESLIWSYN